MKRKAKAVIVGGSIAGLSCAHSLIAADWEVVVIDKSASPPKRSPTGAGLGLDPQSCKFIHSWLPKSHLLPSITTPLTIDQNQLISGEKKARRVLARDENLNFRAAYWPDLHAVLESTIISYHNVILWGHLFMGFCVSDDKASVTVKAKVVETEEMIEIVGDLLVAADGCLSSIRRHFLPHLKLRYSGYIAWRGVLDFSCNENSDTIIGLRKAYPDLGKCLYVDLGFRTHCALNELVNKKINWIWYINQPEPELKGNSMTMKVSSDMIEKIHQDAKKMWTPEFVRVIKETSEPFVNVIYDCDPLDRFVWDNVVLVGDAAHPTTPHGLRSTNMAILDAAVLGQCLKKWGLDKLGSALKEFESTRLPVTSKQVLHSRKLGRVKQGLSYADHKPFDPEMASPQDCQELLLQRNMPFLC